ncbi:beta strand repeat-containing protein [Novosphingobium sp.]|uniref:beta strand repeat-containing protein n=1 Tax=Novosphingobium sp. TaxID=1874826 RepID=UPI003BAB5A08
MRLRFASAPSLLAMAAMLTAAPMAARAQSFNATGTIVAGLGDISVAPGTTTVATDSPGVVINWSPSDTASGGGPIDFQSAGTSALFSNRDATSLTVLNRILPKDLTRPITFNGTVTSQLIDLATGAVSRGGTVFFYSPGGILVSATGVFNVGNLVLTTSDLNFDAATGVFGNAGTYKFLPANAGSRVEIEKGARITAGPNNAYVALIAPQVINSGLINVDGSAVIVAADASTITFRPNGLFDIQIDQGTSTTGEVVTNDGAITGPVANANAVHRVYMVAVPKNDAITMAIKGGSALGFDVAGAANVDGNAIVLSAGYNIANGLIDTVRAKASAAVPAALDIGAIAATSQVSGKATGQASIVVDSGNAASFASNLSLSGVQDPAAVSNDGAFISVGGIGSTLDVTDNLELTALDGGQVTGSFSTDSGNAAITVDQGSLTVGEAASISSTLEVDALAGSAVLTARGGAVVNIGSDLSIIANGIGKSTDAASNLGPNSAKGGTAQLSLEGGSNVTVGRDLVLDASGTGGGAFLNDFAGADGAGGQAIIEGKANGGVLDITGVTTLDARGIGGIGQRCIACTVEARDIHVAATPFLAQLGADPFFAGVEPALDSVSARSSGPVLRAGALDFTVGRSFYIQRTGSGLDPLGFEEPLDGFKVTSAGASPIAVIINGTFRTDTGLIGGPQAWLQFKQSGFNFSGFTADSRLNGCLLTAATCGLDSRGLPDPGIRIVIEGVGTPAIGDTPLDPEGP